MSRLIPLLLALWLLSPALADDAPPSPVVPLAAKNYASLWVDKTAQVAPEAVSATVAAIHKQQADPQHIVVFVHGFDVKRDSSTAAFDALAERLQQQFDPSKTRAAYAGIQWESADDSSVLQLANVYWQKISLARSVGRGPARELLLALHKAYPKAHLSVMAHSMGCEVAAAAVVPEIEYNDQLPFVDTYQPDTSLRLHMLTLCGSDLDYDIWAKSNAHVRDKDPRTKITWQTVAPYLGKGDRVLSMRAKLRGRAAGTTFPKMTLEQLDQSCSKRHILFDGEDIPTDHAFNKYYDSKRLARIVPVMRWLDNPALEKPLEVAELDAILAAPNTAESLTPFLDNGRYGTLFTTLWRLERLNCGDAAHMTDGTLDEVARLLKDKPQSIFRIQDKTSCKTIANGQFPSPKMMSRHGAPPRSKKVKKG